MPSLAHVLAQSSFSGSNAIWIVVAIVIAIVALVILIVVGQFISLYIQAFLSNAHVGMLEIIGMRLRKVDIRTVVFSRIRAVKAGLDIPTNALETHYLAGGACPTSSPP
jgi:uncharacterized protein YqfA (UPF0365 family)